MPCIAICQAGEEVEIDDFTISQAKFFENVLAEGDHEEEEEGLPKIPVANVEKQTLEKILAFSKIERDLAFDLHKPIKSNDLDTIFPKLIADFLRGLEKRENFEIVRAADFLGYSRCVQVFSALLATHIRNRTTEYIREYFDVQETSSGDLTEEGAGAGAGAGEGSGAGSGADSEAGSEAGSEAHLN